MHNEDAKAEAEVQIIYASRTHSQLMQLAEELKKTEFAKTLHFAALGSRASLCINEKVKTLGSVHKINQKCLDLQKEKDKASKCAFLPGQSHTFSKLSEVCLFSMSVKEKQW